MNDNSKIMHSKINKNEINKNEIGDQDLPRSDHRVIGREMGIFATDPVVGSGLPLWLPAGAVIRHELEQYARAMAMATGCQPVYSPVLAKRELFERSGHWAKFQQDMFPPMDLGRDAPAGVRASDDGQAGDQDPGHQDHGSDQLVLRPANCPHHAMIYAAQQHSYRDLPIRYNELAPMFRAERSGVLAGLNRVRQINLDDTHVFCRPDQLADEVQLALSGILQAFAVLGLEIDHLRLSRRDDGDGYLGDPDQWGQVEDQLAGVLRRAVAEDSRLRWRDGVGEAAFYGPKIDVQVRDARGRQETLSTVQVDFNQPARFGLEYAAADGSRQRVIMIHRGLMGAMERMIAFLLEVHDGRLPLWLAPVQLCLLPVGPGHAEQVGRAADRLRAAGLRVRVDHDGSLGRRIRACRVRRDALIGVIGDREAAEDLIAVDDPRDGSRHRLAVPALAELLSAAVTGRAARIDWGIDRDIDGDIDPDVDSDGAGSDQPLVPTG